MKRLLVLLLLTLFLVSATFSWGAPRTNIKLYRSNGDLLGEVEAELVSTVAARNYGLMYRRSMGKWQGMLFLFATEEPRSFWMKNTYLSLDILFIAADKRIVSIAKETQPLSLQAITSKGRVKYVLELNGGFCQQEGLKEGDRLEFEIPQDLSVE